MLVVADSSPLRYLALIGHVDILPTLFAQVAIPTAVAAELSHANTPEVVRDFNYSTAKLVGNSLSTSRRAHT